MLLPKRDMWTKNQEETNLCGHPLWPLYRAGVMVNALDMEWENLRPQKLMPTFLSVMRLIKSAFFAMIWELSTCFYTC